MQDLFWKFTCSIFSGFLLSFLQHYSQAWRSSFSYCARRNEIRFSQKNCLHRKYMLLSILKATLSFYDNIIFRLSLAPQLKISRYFRCLQTRNFFLFTLVFQAKFSRSYWSTEPSICNFRCALRVSFTIQNVFLLAHLNSRPQNCDFICTYCSQKSRWLTTVPTSCDGHSISFKSMSLSCFQ